MTAKEFLRRGFVLERELRAKREQLARLRSLRGGAGGSLRPDKVQTSPKASREADLSDAIVDLENELTAELVRLLRVMKEINAAINGLEDGELRLVLFERYVNLKKWEDICEDNHMSWDTVHRKHRVSLKKIRIESYTIS